MSEVRLQKYIADCGITSRRKAEELIVQGRVEVNGELITELGTKVNAGRDAVVVDGNPIDINRVEKMYLLLNKPRGYVTTLNDPEGRKTVMDLVREISERIYPVGRLDYLSEGLLLLTNDGELANKIMHPSHEVVKVYEVKVFGAVNETILKKLRDGATLKTVLLSQETFVLSSNFLPKPGLNSDWVKGKTVRFVSFVSTQVLPSTSSNV